MKHILNIPLLLTALIGLIILSGHIFTYLWAWFMVPLGLPPLGLAHALGIMLLFGYNLRGLAQTKFEDNDYEGYGKAWYVTFYGYTTSLSFWGVAYVYTLFM